MEMCSYYAFFWVDRRNKLQSIHFWGCFSGIRKAEKYCPFLRTIFLVNGYLLLVCFALTDRTSYMNLWISSVILLLYKLSETLLCCISCVWWISVWNKANHFSFVLPMDATMKADIKPLKSFLWIIVSKCFAIYKPK